MLQVVLSIVTLALSASVSSVGGDTEFTYQGRLDDAGAPANGTFNVDFRLWDDPAAGNQVGSTNKFNSLPILEGLFTAELDFGASAFDNDDRWQEITVEGVPLVPRQTITRTPYAIQTRGIVVNESSRVGIGTDDPEFPLHVEDDINGAAIFGNSNAFGGSGVLGSGDDGVVGISMSTSGRGVYGVATAGNSATYGVYGESHSGSGVYGEATANTGFTYGGRFESDSNVGNGVNGLATANSGTTYGGRFVSFSTSGRGVYGLASASTGTTYGVYGYSSSTNGHGVNGLATATSGTTYGGRFRSLSTSGLGVYGEATATSGTTYGVYGLNNSASGHGVFGQAAATTGLVSGVHGLSDSVSGRGVYGKATTTGQTSGVYG